MGTSAYAYDSGFMSCQDIGNYAAAVVQGKENGTSYKKALAIIDKKIPKGKYQKERKICRDIVKIIYTKPYGQHLTVDGARESFEAECEIQR